MHNQCCLIRVLNLLAKRAQRVIDVGTGVIIYFFRVKNGSYLFQMKYSRPLEPIRTMERRTRFVAYSCLHSAFPEKMQFSNFVFG